MLSDARRQILNALSFKLRGCEVPSFEVLQHLSEATAEDPEMILADSALANRVRI